LIESRLVVSPVSLTTSASPALTGIFRMASIDAIGWRELVVLI